MRKARIQKPSTSKQRANAHRYATKTAEPIFVAPAAAGLPSGSWWVNRDREEFSAAAQQERQRMALSSFGRANSVITAKNTEKVEVF